MKFLRELHDANKAADVLMRLIDFSTYPEEVEQIRQKLLKRNVQPSITNIKKHLISQLLKPSDEIPYPERMIIVRSGRVEEKGGRVFRPKQAV